MSETATEVQMDRMNQMRDLAKSKSNPVNVVTDASADVYAYAFAWLAGVATINPELGEHLDKAINFVKRTYPL